jgi:hypothetical protein
MINSYSEGKVMYKVIRCLVLSLIIMVPVASFAETQEGPIEELNYAQKKFSIEGVTYQLAAKVVIKELYNETNVLLFSQLSQGSYLQVEFSQGSVQPKQVTKAYLVPQ